MTKATPFPQSYWIEEGRLCVGHFPGDLDPAIRERKLIGLLDCGIRRVISLMEPTETGRGGHTFEDYGPRLRALAAERGQVVECLRHAIPDTSTPTRAGLEALLATLDDSLRTATPTYLHCWGGHGRTSTVVACHLIARGRTAEEAIAMILGWRANLPKNHHPFEGDQERFVRSWAARA